MDNTCNRCRVAKPQEQFAISPSTQKITGVCQECWDKHYAHLAKSVEHHKSKKRLEDRKSRRKQIDRNRVYLRSILENAQCMECGNDNWLVLELDHRNPQDKHDAVTRMVNDGTSLDRIKQEVLKCDIVCANCHTIRTAKRGNTWRWQVVNGTSSSCRYRDHG